MLLIACPHCGPRAQEEFVYERTADAVLHLDDRPIAALAALYCRENARGVSQELWFHGHGCRSWLMIARDRVSHDIAAIRALGPDPVA